jgi:MFS family permease
MDIQSLDNLPAVESWQIKFSAVIFKKASTIIMRAIREALRVGPFLRRSDRVVCTFKNLDLACPWVLWTGTTEIIMTAMVPLRFRGQWLALISVAWATGTVTGPLLGGLLAGYNSWSWAGITEPPGFCASFD